MNFSWATLSRVDRVDPYILRKMFEAGCYELEFGVEAGSQKILDAMDKRTSIDQVHSGLEMSYDSGIKNKVFLIHGFPGENYDTTMETIEMLEKVGKWINRTSLFRFVPLPGTFTYKNPEIYGIKGTYDQPDWDGDWGKFHIHHNHHHWWGDDCDFIELNRSYKILNEYIESRWPSRFRAEELPEDEWGLQSKKFIRTNK